MTPLQHLDAAEGCFARCRRAEDAAAHGPHPSIRHYPLGQLARAVAHVAAANALLTLAALASRPCPPKARYQR